MQLLSTCLLCVRPVEGAGDRAETKALKVMALKELIFFLE